MWTPVRAGASYKVAWFHRCPGQTRRPSVLCLSQRRSRHPEPASGRYDMKSRPSYTVRVVGLAAVLVTAPACGGAKGKAAAASGVAGGTTSTGAVSTAAAGPVKATGGG